MPADLLIDPLGIACVFSDGRRKRRFVGDADPALLVHDLLSGLAGMVHPHGSVDSPGTLGSYLLGLRSMAAFMNSRGVLGGASDLTRGQLAEYWMQTDRVRESTTRRMLAAFGNAGGHLQPGVRALVDGRHFTPRQPGSPLVPYTGEEWDRLHQECRRTVDEAFAAHRRALRAAARGEDPRIAGWSADNQRWLLMRLGPTSDRQIGEYLGCSGTWVARRGGIRAGSDELFPDVNVVIAYRLLLGMYSGIVADGIADLGLDDIDWAGDATVLLSYVKGRTAAESLTLSRRAVRLLERWLEHSAAVRDHAPPGIRNRLWLYYSYSGPTRWPDTIEPSTHQLWADQHGVERLDRRRIRTTYLSLRDRSRWHGSARSAIDPNHTPAVEGDNYLTAATPAQVDAVESIIEDAQRDMLRRAELPVVLADDEAAELARGYPELVARLNVEDAAIAELVSGEQDVFVAACADPLSGLHGPPGKPCPARPWVCLLCPLAIFAPRHAGNLLRLKAFFARQWQQMPSDQFMAVFGPYSTRIQQILDHYSPSLLSAAANSMANSIDGDDGIPLRPEERTI